MATKLGCVRDYIVCVLCLDDCVFAYMFDLRSQTPSSRGVCRCYPGMQPLSVPRPPSRLAPRQPPASPLLPVPHPKWVDTLTQTSTLISNIHTSLSGVCSSEHQKCISSVKFWHLIFLKFTFFYLPSFSIFYHDLFFQHCFISTGRCLIQKIFAIFISLGNSQIIFVFN